MGMSYDQWIATTPAALHHLHPDHPSNRNAAGVALCSDVQPRPARPGSLKVNDKGQNKTEAAFDTHLAERQAAGSILEYAWEPLKLRIGPRTWLTLDFAVKRLPPRHLALVDVKGGPWEDDAAVKLKVAAEKFAWLADVYVVRRSGRHGWEAWPVTPRGGIARQPIVDGSWLTPMTEDH